jgi:ABC-type Na+ transport system ATPase subunit NatA
MDEVEALADRLIILNNGEVIAAGTPAGLILETEGAKNLEDVFLTRALPALAAS